MREKETWMELTIVEAIICDSFSLSFLLEDLWLSSSTVVQIKFSHACESFLSLSLLPSFFNLS